MVIGMWKLCCCAAVVVAASPLGAQQVERIGIAVGESPAPVSVLDLDGQPVDLGTWIGKRPVLFEFWATWCENCEALEPQLRRLGEQYGDRVDFVVIAVAVNQRVRGIRRHLEQHPTPFPVLWDGRGAAARAFMAPATSYIVVLDAAGRVTYTGLGAAQDLEAALRTALE